MRKWLAFAFGSLVGLLILAGLRFDGHVEVLASVQEAEGSLTVTADEELDAGVDVFAIINAGKVALGTTNAVGQLPFDPSLLTGKVRVQVAVRRCPDRREVYFIESESVDACEEVERTSEDDEECDCEPAGIIWWGNVLRVDVVSLTASGAGRLTSNPVFWTGLAGGGAAATAVVLTSGDEEVTTTVPPVASPPTTTTTTSAPPTTTSTTAADLTGTYDINVTGVNDPGGHRPFTGDPPRSIDVTVNNGNFTARGQAPWVTVNGSIDANGRFNASGRGTVAGRSNVMVTFEGDIGTSMPFPLQGTYRMGTNGELPGGDSIDFLLDGRKR